MTKIRKLTTNTIKLTPEEELQLFRNYRENNCTASAEKIIIANIPFVKHMVRKHAPRWMEHYDDIFQDGVIALMKAVKAYNPDHGVRFISYAKKWVIPAIYEYMQNNISGVKLITTNQQKKVFYNIGRYKQYSDASLTPDQIKQMAIELNVPERDIIDVEFKLSNSASVYLDEDDSMELESTWDTSYETMREYDDKINAVYAAMNTLNPRELDIFEKRHLSDDAATLVELGKQYGVSPARIGQIDEKASRKVCYTARNLLTL